MTRIVLFIGIVFLFLPEVVLAQDAKLAVETIRLKSAEVQRSRGTNPNIDLESCLVTNSVGETLVFDENSCTRFDNLTDYSITLYRNRNPYAIIPPRSSMDAKPILGESPTAYYAIANFSDNSVKEWGPHLHQAQSCVMIIFE